MLYRRRVMQLIVLSGLLLASQGRGLAQAVDPAQTLQDLSLEDLVEVEVTSASRKPERPFETAAAVFVLTTEDIRRSGATNLPELLRLVPGLHVSRIDSNKWSIGARGFAGRYSNKLLVMIDGRSVYNPLFSGTFWNSVDVPLEDIQQVEVVRGSGAAVWGDNAVTGIINVITKKAHETQGYLAATTAGIEDPSVSTARVGGRLGTRVFYRTFLRYRSQDESRTLAGLPAADEWHDFRGGFRLDWDRSDGTSVMFEGNAYDTRADERLGLILPAPPYRTTWRGNLNDSGVSLLGRLARNLGGNSDLKLQAYIDHSRTEAVYFAQDLNTTDIDFQHRFRSRTGRHEFVWGLGYRISQDGVKNTFAMQLVPPSRSAQLSRSFIQDEIRLADSNVRLTLGSKLGWSTYNGWDVQPNVRAIWTPSSSQAFWGAVSRSIRTSSRIDSDIRWTVDLSTTSPLPPGSPLAALPFEQQVVGNPDFEAEVQKSVELGYRRAVYKHFTIEASLFYNAYSRLQASELAPLELRTTPFPRLTQPIWINNSRTGSVAGGELQATVHPRRWWRLHGAWSEARRHLRIRHPFHGQSIQDPQAGDASAGRWATVQSRLDVGRRMEFDTAIRWSGGVSAVRVASYTSLDARFGFRLTQGLELALVGRDLLSPGHAEYGPMGFDGSFETITVRRGAHATLTWKGF